MTTMQKQFDLISGTISSVTKLNDNFEQKVSDLKKELENERLIEIQKLTDTINQQQKTLHGQYDTLNGTAEQCLIHHFGSRLIEEIEVVRFYTELENKINLEAQTYQQIPVIIEYQKAHHFCDSESVEENTILILLFSSNTSANYFFASRETSQALEHAFGKSRFPVVTSTFGLNCKHFEIDKDKFFTNSDHQLVQSTKPALTLYTDIKGLDGKSRYSMGSYSYSDQRESKLPEISTGLHSVDLNVHIGWKELANFVKQHEQYKMNTIENLYKSLKLMGLSNFRQIKTPVTKILSKLEELNNLLSLSKG